MFKSNLSIVKRIIGKTKKKLMKNLEKSIEIEKNDFVVYIHVRLDNNQPFYVGKGRKYRPYDFTNRNKYWKKPRQIFLFFAFVDSIENLA